MREVLYTIFMIAMLVAHMGLLLWILLSIISWFLKTERRQRVYAMMLRLKWVALAGAVVWMAQAISGYGDSSAIGRVFSFIIGAWFAYEIVNDRVQKVNLTWRRG